MNSQFFVKFQYHDKIKKISLSESEFYWDNLCNILSKSFLIPKDGLKLTYKDPEGDEITACCDDDLIEAYRACSSIQPLRFFVYKCNGNSSREKSHSIDQGSTSNSKELKRENMVVEERKIKSETSIVVPHVMIEKENSLPVVNKEPIESPKEKKVTIKTEEITSILEEILSSKEAKEKILNLRRLHEGKQMSFASYLIETDKDKLADYVSRTFDKVLNETLTIDVDGNKSSARKALEDMKDNNLKESPVSKEWKPFQEEQKTHFNRNQSIPDSNLFNVSLKESIYENSYLSSIKEPRGEDFKERSFARSSMSFCKDLSSTYGVKLALKYENGKMKLMSVPSQHEYSIIESVGNQKQERNEQNSGLKKSTSMNAHPDSKKDYSELVTRNIN